MKIVNWEKQLMDYTQGKPVVCPVCGSKNVEVIVYKGATKNRNSLSFKCNDCGSPAMFG